jgi:hypothetical protein
MYQIEVKGKGWVGYQWQIVPLANARTFTGQIANQAPYMAKKGWDLNTVIFHEEDLTGNVKQIEGSSFLPKTKHQARVEKIKDLLENL